MLELALYIGIILIASFVVWKGGGMLEKSSDKLAIHYKLSPIVHGTILTAVGSSFPELSTTVISTLIHGEFDLGVSAIVGSAIFNILVIPGLSAIAAKRMKSKWSFVVKDVQYYVTSIALLLLIFAVAVIYYPTNSSSSGHYGIVTRGLALIPFIYYLFYLYLQKKETRAYQEENKRKRKKFDNISKIWLSFTVSLILIVASVEGLVRGALFLGDYFDTPNFIWGILVLATATSVPDAVVSIKEAIHDKGIISLANVIGSNIFDLLIAVPAGIIIAGSAAVNFSIAAPMMLYLSLSTILLIVFLLRKDNLTASEGWFLLAAYALFIAWVILESLGQLNWVQT